MRLQGVLVALLCHLCCFYSFLVAKNGMKGPTYVSYAQNGPLDEKHSGDLLQAIPGAPHHVAYIVDGNGRWATQKGLKRQQGHTEGARTTVEVVRNTFSSGVSVCTLYLFSTENWNRPMDEISNIFQVLEQYLVDFLDYLVENRVRLLVIGQDDRLPASTRTLLHHVRRETERCLGADTSTSAAHTLCLALSYGGKADIVHAARLAADAAVRGDLEVSEITEDVLNKFMSTGALGISDPDLVVRTSGEFRLSNFFLWQSAYAEFLSLPILWPDMTKEHLHETLVEYSRRKRRFGGVSERERDE